jgi:hypothetical protein
MTNVRTDARFREGETVAHIVCPSEGDMRHTLGFRKRHKSGSRRAVPRGRRPAAPANRQTSGMIPAPGRGVRRRRAPRFWGQLPENTRVGELSPTCWRAAWPRNGLPACRFRGRFRSGSGQRGSISVPSEPPEGANSVPPTLRRVLS